MLHAIPELVDAHCGIVRTVERIEGDLRSPPLPIVYRAQLANHRLIPRGIHELGAWGKGMTEADALRSALGEAVERYAAHCWRTQPVELARRRDLGAAALDPRRLVLHLPHQYAKLPMRPYADDALLGWVTARCLVDDSTLRVPAQAVYLSYFAAPGEEYLFTTHSNGLAAHGTRVDAVWSALCEVLERDAFMIAWLQRLPCETVPSAAHPDPVVRQVHEGYARRGIELRLLRIPTDHPCAVFAAFLIDRSGEGPAVASGLGSELDPLVAGRKAVLEAAQIRPGLAAALSHAHKRAEMARLAADPRRVVSPHEHALLFAHRSALPRLNALQGRAARWTAPRVPGCSDGSSARKLAFMRGVFRARGWQMLYYDLTPPEIARLGLHVARVIVPDFQPIDFGWAERRLAGERLHELPRTLGLRRTRSSFASLNPFPHPMA